MRMLYCVRWHDRKVVTYKADDPRALVQYLRTQMTRHPAGVLHKLWMEPTG